MSWSGFGGIDLSGVEAEQGRKTLTPGAHPCRISEAEIKTTKDGRGHGLKVVFEALDGSGSVDDFINLHNSNSEAERIGKQRLKAMLIAAHHPSPDRPGDVRTLLGRQVGVHVEKGEDWVDKDGNTRPGGGKPRRSGAYYALSAAPTSPAGQSIINGGGYDDLDDEIPF